MGKFRRRITLGTAAGLVSVLMGATTPAQADGSDTDRAAWRTFAQYEARLAAALSPAATTPKGTDPPRSTRTRHSPAPGLSGLPPLEMPRSPRAASRESRTATVGQGPICGPPYVNDDPRLGPKYLPRKGYFGFLLRGHMRYGGTPPQRFLYRYWDETATPPGWRFPSDLGFTHDGGYTNGRPIRFRATLSVGKYIDRFGGELGSFLAPAGTAFPQRALPPDSLNTRSDDPAHLCNYHLYRVTDSFDVGVGLAAPAFQQPGLGWQYLLIGSYVPGAPSPLTVRWLVDNGYLERIH